MRITSGFKIEWLKECAPRSFRVQFKDRIESANGMIQLQIGVGPLSTFTLDLLSGLDDCI